MSQTPSSRSARMLRSVMSWLVAIVAMAVLASSLLAWQHFRERKGLDHFTTMLESLHEARAEVAKAYLFVSRSIAPDSSFVREQGIAALDQAAASLHKHLADVPLGQAFVEPADAPILHAGFVELERTIRDFHDLLSRPAAQGEQRVAAEIEERAAFLDFERDVDSLESRIRASMRQFLHTQNLFFALTLWVSAAFSVLVLAAIVNAIKRQARAERKALESEDRLQSILASLEDVVWSMTADRSRLLFMSPSAQRLFGRPARDFFADPGLWLKVVHPDDRTMVEKAFEQSQSRGTNEIEYRIVRPDGDVRWLRDRTWVVRDVRGQPLRIDGIATDITGHKAQEQKIEFLAYYDVLTQLPNRQLLKDRIDQAIHLARREGSGLALLFLDLDGFKNVNDSIGHAAGDKLLRIVTDRLRKSVREHDTVARLGGDEFVILVQETHDNTDAAVVAQKILGAISAPVLVEGQEFSITASVGISLYPGDGADVETLIKNADASMYLAKQSGRNNYQFFTPELNERAFERLRMENGLRKALQRGEFFLHYQPQVELASGRIVGTEALVRWRHPEWGVIPPARFIPLAEESGLIVPIGEWVLNEACRQNRAWQDAGLPPVPVSVNLAAAQFHKPDCAEMIQRALRNSYLDPQYLDVEVTESAMMDDAQQVLATLHRLKTIGVLLSLDDFGTGYSSLSYLKRFPIDKLKIDQAFVRDIARSASDAAITTAMINLAKSLGLATVAEGVETSEQLAFMRSHGCDVAQGYYFSAPVGADELGRMLRLRTPAWAVTPIHPQLGGYFKEEP